MTASSNERHGAHVSSKHEQATRPHQLECVVKPTTPKGVPFRDGLANWLSDSPHALPRLRGELALARNNASVARCVAAALVDRSPRPE